MRWWGALGVLLKTNLYIFVYETNVIECVRKMFASSPHIQCCLYVTQTRIKRAGMLMCMLRVFAHSERRVMRVGAVFCAFPTFVFARFLASQQHVVESARLASVGR